MDRNALRVNHSSMEEDRSSSYFLMATDKTFSQSYEIYVEILKTLMQNKKNVFKILNIGFGAGNLENIICKNIKGNYLLYSIDNSKSNYKFAEKLNKDYLYSGKLQLLLQDIIKDDIQSGPFDVILSRDLNHHLIDIPFYLKKCSGLLNSDGIMLMEDLRYDADPDGILRFSRNICNVKKLNSDHWLLYQKLLGFVESLASAYTSEEINKLTKKYFLGKKFILSSLRYHYILANNPLIIKKHGFILEKLKATQ